MGKFINGITLVFYAFFRLYFIGTFIYVINLQFDLLENQPKIFYVLILLGVAFTLYPLTLAVAFKFGWLKTKIDSSLSRYLRKSVQILFFAIPGLILTYLHFESINEPYANLALLGLGITLFIIIGLILWIIYLFFTEQSKIVQQGIKAKEVLDIINNNKDIYSKEHLKINYSVNWNKKIYPKGRSAGTIDVFWAKLKSAYLFVESKNINKGYVVTSIDYYPEVVKKVFDYYLLGNYPHAKIKLVTNMLPEYFFNFPGYKQGRENLCFYRRNFVDSYRKVLKEFIETYKDKYSENIDNFKRYVILKESDDIDVPFAEELATFDDFKRSLEYNIQVNNPLKGCYTFDKSGKKYIFHNAEFTNIYTITNDSNRNSVKLLNYYIDHLNLNSEMSFISVLSAEEIRQIDGKFDFILIETEEFKICIEAKIAIENNSVKVKVYINESKNCELDLPHEQIISCFQAIIEEKSQSLKDFMDK